MTEITTAQDAPQSDTNGSEYRCPFCTSTYPDERLTRAHITWSDDDNHRNRSGFMPETRIEVLDDDGTVIEERSRRPEELNTNDIPLEVFPDELSESKKRVCRIVAYNPNIDSYAEIHDRSDAVLSENGLDTVGYNTVRRWIQEFLMPHVDTSNTEDVDAPTELSPDELLQDLTEKQRAVITQHVENPSLSMGELADQADVSRSYPTQILDKYDDLIDTLREVIDEDDIVSDPDMEEEADVVNEASQVSPINKGDTNWSDADTVASVIEPVQETSIDDEYTEPDPTDDTVRDGPVNGATSAVMSASPPDLFSEATESGTDDQNVADSDAEDSSSADKPTDKTPTNSESQPDQTPSATRVDEEAVESGEPSGTVEASETIEDGAQVQSETIPSESVVEVLERVQFQRRIAEREVDAVDSERAASQLAILAELELELQQLLQ